MPEWQQDAVNAAKEALDSKDWLELPSKFDIHEWDIIDRFGGLLPSERRGRECATQFGGMERPNFKGTIRRLGIEDAWFEHQAPGAQKTCARSAQGARPTARPEGAAQPGVAPDGASPRR